MNTETGQLHRDPSPETLANPKVVPITEEENALLEKVPEGDRPECLRLLRSITGYKPKENEANVVEALKAERARQDAILGLREDDPEDFKEAVRNMGPTTRKLFMKKVNKQKLTDAKLKEYIAHYAPNAVKTEVSNG